MIGCTALITIDAQAQLYQKLGNQFNGRRLWPLHVRCRRKTFTFAISSSDELLSYRATIHRTMCRQTTTHLLDRQQSVHKWHRPIVRARKFASKIFGPWKNHVSQSTNQVLPRDVRCASAAYTVALCLSVCLSIGPSVTSRRSTNTAKLTVTQTTPYTTARGFQFSGTKERGEIPMGLPPTVAPNTSGVG